MTSSPKRLFTAFGIVCAVASAGPIAVAAAAPSGTPLPGQSCSANQGLPAGIQNLSPTGPLGPLGSSGPLGNDNSLPCGSSAFDLGPTGPLGPGGALRSAAPAPGASSRAPSGSSKHSSHSRKHANRQARHTHKRAHRGHRHG
jgi:hypothetical protein